MAHAFQTPLMHRYYPQHTLKHLLTMGLNSGWFLKVQTFYILISYFRNKPNNLLPELGDRMRKMWYLMRISSHLMGKMRQTEQNF